MEQNQQAERSKCISGMSEAIANAKQLVEYQQKAMAFRKEDSSPRTLMHAVVGMGEEAGELLGLYKKVEFFGHALDRVKLVGELGDMLWYSACAAYAIDAPLDVLLDSGAGRAAVAEIEALYVTFRDTILVEAPGERERLAELIRPNAALAFGEASAALNSASHVVAFFQGMEQNPEIGQQPPSEHVFAIYGAIVLTVGAIGAIARDVLGMSILEIGEANLAKLTERYGDKFSVEASNNRDEVAEAAAIAQAA